MAGIYIHIPFCKQACHYCNFHFATSLRLKDAFVAALIREISITPALEALHEGEPEEEIETIYFGGGTPSILATAALEEIMHALQQRFNIAAGAEITLEANPDDINAIRLKEWQSVGVNRLSVGIQSFQDQELKWMNRAHTAAESLHCIHLIEAAGFKDYSIDLIYGSPLLSDAAWKSNVATILQYNIPHVSCYALTVEPKTRLDKLVRQEQAAPTDADQQAAQFLQLMDWMEAAGFEHYEISNFAKPGYRSRHNSSYWQGATYYGFGPSAHSFNGQRRRWNVANNGLYIQSINNGTIPFEEEILTATQELNEYIMTSLRTIEGLDLTSITQRFGEEKALMLQKASEKWQQSNRLFQSGALLQLTREGKLFADGIAADLFF